VIAREPARNSSRSGKSYEGSLANIIQQMDEVIALTRRSNPSSDAAILPKHTPSRSTELPQLTRVSERNSSRSSSSSSSIRRNSLQVKNERHLIKRQHSGPKSPTIVSEVSPILSTLAPRKFSTDNSPNKINQHVISVSSIHSDSDSHIVDMSNVAQ